MDNLSKDELKKVVESLMKVTKCAVCLDVLKLDTVVCVNGHVICADCKRTQRSCPTCRKGFSNVENTAFVRQMLEVIPYTCSHKGCPDVVYKGDDHEKYCKYRYTQCKVNGCTWQGCVQDLFQHFKSHIDTTTHFWYKKETLNSFHLKKSNEGNVVYHMNEQVFWLKREYNPNSGVMTFTVFPVLGTKPKTDFVFKVTFNECRVNEQPTASTTFTRKVHLDSGEVPTEKNIIYVPITILQQFWDEKNLKLEFTCEVKPRLTSA